MTPAPLSNEDKFTMDSFYLKMGVYEGTVEKKNKAIQTVIGPRKFIISGGSTPEMELRANERIYLHEECLRKLREEQHQRNLDQDVINGCMMMMCG